MKGATVFDLKLFGKPAPMPDGYQVIYWEGDEHYHWARGEVAEGDWDGPFSDPWMARRFAQADARGREASSTQGS